MADLTINGDRDGLRLSWPKVIAVVVALVVFGVSIGRVLANQELQKEQNAVTNARLDIMADKLDKLTIAVELLKVPPRTDSQNRIAR